MRRFAKIAKRISPPAWCAVAAVLALTAWIILRIQPADVTAGGRHDNLLQGDVYLTMMETGQLSSLTFAGREGASLTVNRVVSENGAPVFQLADSGDVRNQEALDAAVAYATALTALDTLGKFDAQGKLENGGVLADFGLDPPVMTVTVTDLSGRTVCVEVGNLLQNMIAYYARVTVLDRELSSARTDTLYLIDAQAGDLFTSPDIFRLRGMWPGQDSDRPSVTLIRVSRADGTGYTIERIADEDAIYGAAYRLTEPFEFLCNNESVRQKVLSDVLGMDFDAYVGVFEDDAPSNAELGFALGGKRDTLYIEAEGGFSIQVAIGGADQEGGRYLMHDGEVYLDRIGGYGFLELTPLDLTYGVAFWLYKFEDAVSVTITSGEDRWSFTLDNKEYVYTLERGGISADVKEISMRRLFARLLNFSVYDQVTPSGGARQTVIKLQFADGSSHTLSFGETVNARLIPVSVDGGSPELSCNIKDLQAVFDALDLIEKGDVVPEM